MPSVPEPSELERLLKRLEWRERRRLYRSTWRGHVGATPGQAAIMAGLAGRLWKDLRRPLPWLLVAIGLGAAAGVSGWLAGGSPWVDLLLITVYVSMYSYYRFRVLPRLRSTERRNRAAAEASSNPGGH